jgi:small GTP-binding protein
VIQKKICMVGAFGVGKTSLVARYVRSIFSEKYQTTVGVKIDKKVVDSRGTEVTLVLWDLAGEDALTTVKPSQLKGASGYILVVDGLRRQTLDAAIDLQWRVTESIGATPFVCVLNKADVREAWEVQPTDLEPLAAQHWPLIETSAKTGAGVEKLFQTLADVIMQEHHVTNSATGAIAG